MRVKVTNVPKVLKDDSAKRLRRELTKARDQVGAEFRKAVVLAIHASKPPPIDQGTLVGGIVFHPTPNTLDGVVTTTPVSHPYNIVMELGRRPGQPGPPLAPILAWVLRKGIASGKEAKRAASAIRHKIHTKGIEARGFFARARKSPEAKRKSVALVLAAVRRWKKGPK